MGMKVTVQITTLVGVACYIAAIAMMVFIVQTPLLLLLVISGIVCFVCSALRAFVARRLWSALGNFLACAIGVFPLLPCAYLVAFYAG